MIGLPSYSWKVSMGTLRSLLTDLPSLPFPYLLHDTACGTEISQARNQIVDDFLGSDCTDLVFVDDDVCWQRGALPVLLSQPVDCVACIYRKREDAESYPVRWLEEKSDLQADDETGLLEVASVPAGFWRMTRRMLAGMEEHYRAELRQRTDRAKSGHWTALFDPLWRDGVRYSEDISLCIRWRDMGGSVWVMPNVNMGHMGPKSFNGNLGNWLRTRNGND
jgi:hypothetical protein